MTTTTKPPAVEIGQRLVGATAACRACNAPMLWAISSKQRRIPINPTPAGDGNIILVPIEDSGERARLGAAYRAQIVGAADEIKATVARFTSHFATCENADRFRKGNRR